MNADLLSIPTRVKGRWRRGTINGTRLLVVCVVLLAFVTMAVPPPTDYYRHQLTAQTSGLSFNFFTWEVVSLLHKLGSELAAPQDTLTEAQRHQLVTDYMDRLREAQVLRDEIRRLYSENNGGAPTGETAARERELADLRDWLARRQDLVEGILEEQVSTELLAEGFGRWGYVWPPVKIRFTPLPLLLVTSARAAITRDGDIHLKAGLPLTEQEGLEARVDTRFSDKRSLVTPIGGLSAYPAMILETDALVWLADTFAHEWTHHYLIFHPLGAHYTDSGEMTSINETTACIVGREVGRRVVEGYYPELADQFPPLPEPPDMPPMSSGEIIWPDEPPPDQFDYNREMRETRLRVDELLAAGEIEEAEAYMEERRQFLIEHGHHIRKLNQAYFSFYGSYATGPSTANPIGGQLEWLRAQHGSVRAFLRTVSRLTSCEGLLDLLPARQDD